MFPRDSWCQSCGWWYKLWLKRRLGSHRQLDHLGSNEKSLITEDFLGPGFVLTHPDLNSSNTTKEKLQK